MWKTNTRSINSENSLTSTAVASSTVSLHRFLSLEGMNRGKKVVLNNYSVCKKENLASKGIAAQRR